jgi:flagellar basal-body rod modification protein FlgD
MQVNSLTPLQSDSKQGKAPSGSTVSYDAFLQLLVAQLKNQDPTKPVDSSQYVSQLATLSSLEQAIKQTKAVEEMAQRGKLADAGSVIGRRLESADKSLSGIVVAVRTEGYGLLAELDTGVEVVLNTGERISRA